MKSGIFGGSFDPVHNDHIKILKKFMETFSLDRVIVLPAGISPFKSGAKVSGKHRVNMLKLAFSSLKNVEIDERELNRQGKSYTYQSVLEISKENPLDELFLLIGADNLESFHKWKNPESILSACTLTCAGRGGYDFSRAKKIFNENNKGNLTTFEFDGSISSSYLRELLMMGIYDENYCSKEVLDYIRKNNLYKGDDYYGYIAKVLKKPRLYHTAGVVVTCEKYAKKLGEDVEKARLAGLLHDVAKYMEADDFKEFVLPEGVVPAVIHQYLGAYVAENVLKVKDEDILNAIKFHTTGRPQMSSLEKIVFVADLLEPTRNYGEVDILRKAVDDDFESGFRLCVKRSLDHLEKSGMPIFPLTYKTCEYYKEN